MDIIYKGYFHHHLAVVKVLPCNMTKRHLINKKCLLICTYNASLLLLLKDHSQKEFNTFSLVDR